MITAPAVAAVEVLRVAPETSRAASMLDAMTAAASAVGLEAVPTTDYRGACEWLLLWGPGAPMRAEAMRRHVAAGGHALAFDLAYWNRDKKVRVSIDAPHPQAWVMSRTWSKSRLQINRPFVADRWRATGPVIVAGIGQKAQVQYGPQVDAWERSMLAEAQQRWPDRGVIYRPKPKAPESAITQALSGASLVITWHSNIAVDAIRLGIPAVCRDGAAAAVCPSELPERPTPLDPDVRDRFLTNLAWFQWAPAEAADCWRFLQGLLR